MSIILATAMAAVAVGAIFFYRSKKSSRHILRELRYDMEFQVVGAGALLDDWIQAPRNRVKEWPDRDGNIAVVTGGGRGIGLEIVKKLLRCKMTVIIGVRRPETVKQLSQTLENGERLVVYRLDLESMASVREFAREVTFNFPSLNLLVNNAGIMFGDFKLTQDGFESQLATNYLGHFLLTHLLMPSLRKGGEKGRVSRVVNVSSCAHFPGKIYFDDINMVNEYISAAAYAQSKLAQIMFTRYLDQLLEKDSANVKCYAVHPGVVNTDLFDNTLFKKHFSWAMNLFFKSPRRGAISVLHCCLDEGLTKTGGIYISNCREGYTNGVSKIVALQEKLFDVTCDMLQIKRENFGKNTY